MKYYNLDIRMGIGTAHPEEGKVYPTSAYFSEGGEAHGSMHFPFSEQVKGTNTITAFPLNEAELKQQLEQIECNLYRRSVEDKRSASDRERPMQLLGQALFDTMFSGRIRDLFNKAVNSLNEEREERLRIRLSIQPPELVALPWEFLFWSDLDDFLCLDRRYSVVRYQDLPALFGPLKVELPLRIFGMISLPNDQSKIDAMQEKSLIKRGMKASGKGKFTLQWGANGTTDELRQNMSNHNWHVFHYIGHGELNGASKQGVLIAVNKSGESTALDAKTLGQLLRNPFMRLVVLNTCEGSKSDPSKGFSSIASTLAQKNIPAIVAFQYKVTDTAAIRFAQSFYQTLVKQEYIDAAVTEARLAMKVAGSMEWGSLVLYLRSKDGVLFDMSEILQKNKDKISNDKDEENAIIQNPPPSATELHADGKSKIAQGLYTEAIIPLQDARTTYKREMEMGNTAIKTELITVCDTLGDVFSRLGLYPQAEQAYQEAERLKNEWKA